MGSIFREISRMFLAGRSIRSAYEEDVMDESQGVSSGPVSQPPPAAPMPAPTAYPPPRKMDVSKPALVIAVIALALALIGMVAFPGPTGSEGPEGPAGADGADGDDGDDGADGANGADGIACWDLNGNGVGDPAEDINGDLVVDVNDCTGPEGPQGPQGPQGPPGGNGTDGANGTACWDLNGNGIGDLPDEDINGDSVVNVTDCAGPEGPQGPVGPQGPQGDPGPGAIIATGVSGSTTTIGIACTHYDNAEVTITVPSDGTIIVTAQIWVRISHTFGTEDSWRLAIGENPTDCASAYYRWADSITSNAPNDSDADRTGSPHRVFFVSAGTYTYYANGYMVSGQDVSDVFWYASLIAVFYPS